MNVKIDRYRSKFNHHKAASYIKEVVQNKYADIWRDRHPNAREYTWFRHTKRRDNRACARLDFFLVNDHLRSRVDNIKHTPEILSDHSQVEINIYSNLPAKGKGFWKMNTKYLDNPEYIVGITQILEKARKKYRPCNRALKWEMIKTEIITFTILYSVNVNRMRKEKYEQLVCTLDYLQKQFAETENSIFYDEMQQVQGELECVLQEKHNKYVFHSKARYHNEGERNTKYFFWIS